MSDFALTALFAIVVISIPIILSSIVKLENELRLKQKRRQHDEKKNFHEHFRQFKEHYREEEHRKYDEILYRYANILEVSPNASFTQIKQAYRQRVTEYHPDRVVGLGVDLRKLAEEKMKAINEAYRYFEDKFNQEEQRRQEELRRQEERRRQEEQRREEEQRHKEEERRRRIAEIEARYASILGVPPNAGFAEIKQAYHQRIMEYHPDRVSGLGVDLRKLAEEKTKAINEAFAYFQKKFHQEESRQQEEQRREEEQRRQEEQKRQEEQRRRFTATELRYFEILGVEPGTNFAEIKKGYHKRCLQYHPDTVAHLGEEYKRIAGEKMQAINEAYRYFQRHFK